MESVRTRLRGPSSPGKGAGIQGNVTMSLIASIRSIPRKEKNGANAYKVTTTFYVKTENMKTLHTLAKEHNAGVGGIVDIALERLFSDITTEKEGK
jgi:hypothetical protein